MRLERERERERNLIEKSGEELGPRKDKNVKEIM